MAIIDRLAALYKERLEDQELLRQLPKGKSFNATGSATIGEVHDHHFFAIAEYVLNGNVAAFRDELVQAAAKYMRLFDMHEAGRPISPSYIGMLGYRQLFDGLASGDFAVAQSLAVRLGCRDEIEKEHDGRFTRDLGYLLKYAVLDDREQVQHWLPLFAESCQEQERDVVRGHGHAISAIFERDLLRANEALIEIAKGHQLMARDPEWFAETEDELVSVWGIGMANLARYRGLDVTAIPPFIPADLLIRRN